MTAELAGNVMFVLIVVTGGVIVHHSVILHTNLGRAPLAAAR